MERNDKGRDAARRPSFELDDRQTLRLDKNLAWELAMVLSDDDPLNPAVKEIGRQLFITNKPPYIKGRYGATYEELKKEMDEHAATKRREVA